MPAKDTPILCDICMSLFTDSNSRDEILFSHFGFEYRRVRIDLENAADRGCPICEALTRRDLRYPWINPGNHHCELRKQYHQRPVSYPPANEELVFRIKANSAACTRIMVGAVQGVNFGNMNVVFIVFTPAGKGYCWHIFSWGSDRNLLLQKTRLPSISPDALCVRMLDLRNPLLWQRSG
jgi:hypothetical protein